MADIVVKRRRPRFQPDQGDTPIALLSSHLRAMTHHNSSTFRKIKMTAFPTPIIKTG